MRHKTSYTVSLWYHGLAIAANVFYFISIIAHDTDPVFLTNALPWLLIRYGPPIHSLIIMHPPHLSLITYCLPSFPTPYQRGIVMFRICIQPYINTVLFLHIIFSTLSLYLSFPFSLELSSFFAHPRCFSSLFSLHRFVCLVLIAFFH